MAMVALPAWIRVGNEWSSAVKIPPMGSFDIHVGQKKFTFKVDKDGNMVAPYSKDQEVVMSVFGSESSFTIRRKDA